MRDSGEGRCVESLDWQVRTVLIPITWMLPPLATLSGDSGYASVGHFNLPILAPLPDIADATIALANHLRGLLPIHPTPPRLAPVVRSLFRFLQPQKTTVSSQRTKTTGTLPCPWAHQPLSIRKGDFPRLDGRSLR